MSGTEDPRIANPEHPDSLEHWAIYRAFHPQDTTDAFNAAGKYVRMGADWEANVQEFAARIRRSSASAWDGVAAEASRQAINNYAQRALDFAPALKGLAAQVSTTVTGIINTKTNVAEPKESAWAINPKSWDIGIWEGPRAKDKIDQARDDARDAMKKYYVADFTAADKAIPVLPRPVSPTEPLYTLDPNKGGTPGIDNSNSGGPQPGSVDPGTDGGTDPGTPKTPADEEPADTDPTGTDPASTTPTTTSPAGTSSPGTPTAPTGVDPSSAPTRATGLGPGSYPGGGLGGLPGGGVPGSGLGGGSAGPGRSVPGAPAAGAGGVPAAAAQAGANGRPGMGMPGMGGMGRGKSEEDEKKHEIPEWLRTMENAEELLGSAPRTIPGGVIGGDNPDPQK